MFRWIKVCFASLLHSTNTHKCMCRIVFAQPLNGFLLFRVEKGWFAKGKWHRNWYLELRFSHWIPHTWFQNGCCGHIYLKPCLHSLLTLVNPVQDTGLTNVSSTSVCVSRSRSNCRRKTTLKLKKKISRLINWQKINQQLLLITDYSEKNSLVPACQIWIFSDFLSLLL